jgi:hypothetical protein
MRTRVAVERHESSQAQGPVSGIELPALISLAEEGLANMYDPEAGLFCYTMRRTAAGLERQGVSRRYTMMSLLGLANLERTESRTTSIPVRDVCGRLAEHTDWIDNLGDLGLLLWLCALVAPDRLGALVERAAVGRALATYRDARQRSTMGLAWFLTGLTYAIAGRPRECQALGALARETFGLLSANQGPQGFFGHVARGRSLAGLARGRVGSFADQVYPIYAFSRFGQLLTDRNALGRATLCADAICRVQGSLGQWWWLYDAPSGRVVQQYPVYAVHQEGMAPMALFAVSEATRTDFTQPIYSGLEWIARNELERDLRDGTSQVVWRDIERRNKSIRYLIEVVDFVRPRPSVSAGSLAINHECRPYELGWLLYAFAGWESRVSSPFPG